MDIIMKRYLCLAVICIMFFAAVGMADDMIPIPDFITTYSTGGCRGFWFQSPTSFLITGVRVPDESGQGIQNVEIVRFNSIPPLYSSTTNSFTSLARHVNISGNGVIPVEVAIEEGDIIGILGAAGTTSQKVSYGSVSGFTSSIAGESVTLERLGMGHNLFFHEAADLWREPSDNDIGRAEIYYQTIDAPEIIPEPPETPGTDNTVYWTASTDVSVVSYTVQCSSNSDFSSIFDQAVASSPTLTHEFQGLNAGSTYWYRVRAQSSIYSSAWSDATFSTQIAEAPPEIAGISLSDYDVTGNSDPEQYSNSLILKITLGAVSGGSADTVQISESPSFSAYNEIPYTGQSYFNHTITAGDGIRILYVRPSGPGGNGSPVSDSIIIDTQAPGIPGTPTDAGEWINNTNVSFNWNSASDNGLSGVSGYFCQIGTSPGSGDVLNEYAGNVLNKSITGVDGSTYFCRLHAMDNAGNAGAWSGSSDGITVDISPPDIPASGIHPPPASTLSHLDSIEITFSEIVSGVAPGSLTVNSSPAASLAGNGAGPYIFSGFAAPSDGTVSVSVSTGAIADQAGNPFGGDSWTYEKDSTRPSVILKSSTVADGGSFNTDASFTATFSMDVTGFEAGDIAVTNGAATDFTTLNAKQYAFKIQAASESTVTVQIPAGIATAVDPPNLTNTASLVYSFLYDVTPPSSDMTTSPTKVTGAIPGSFSVQDDGAGVSKVYLYSRKEGLSWKRSGEIQDGIISFTPTDGSGLYYFQSVAADDAGNTETLPLGYTGAGDSSTAYNETVNGPFPRIVSTTGDYCFPMTDEINIHIDFQSLGLARTIIVQREILLDSPPQGYELHDLLQEYLVITDDETDPFVAELQWNYDPEHDNIHSGEINTVFKLEEGVMKDIYDVTPSDNRIVVPGIDSFSEWYAGDSSSFIDAPEMITEPEETVGAGNTVYWTASTDASVTFYTVQCSQNSDFSSIFDEAVVSAPALSHEFSGLSIGSTYWYRARAHSDLYYSVWSDVTFSTQIAEAPPEIAGIYLSDYDTGGNSNPEQYSNSLILKITLGAVTGGSAEYIHISESPDFSRYDEIPYSGQSDFNYTVTEGDGIRTLYLRLFGPGGIGSPVSDSIIMDTQAPGIPGTPTDAGEWINNPNVSFNWNSASDNGMAGVAGYFCQIGKSAGSGDVLNENVGNVLNKSITGADGSTFFCRVYAMDNAGNAGAWSGSSDGITVDLSPPVIPVSSIIPPSSSEISHLDSVEISFSEIVSGVAPGLLTVNSSPAANLSGNGAGSYIFSGFATPADGTVSVSVATGAIADQAGNPFAGDSWTYEKDSTRPSVILSSSSVTDGGAFNNDASFTATFSMDVTGFEVKDITVTNGAATDFTTLNAKQYTFKIQAASESMVTAQIPAGAATAVDPPNATSTASLVYSYLYDITPPSSDMTTSPTKVTGTIPGNFSAQDNGAGISKVYLYSRKEGLSWKRSGEIQDGIISFTPSDGSGLYYFQSVAADDAGNTETLPIGDTGAGDSSTAYNETVNGPFPRIVSTIGEYCFPMTGEININIDFQSLGLERTITVQRNILVGSPPPGYEIHGLLQEYLVITDDGTDPFIAELQWNYDPRHDNIYTGEINTVFKLEGGVIQETYNVTPSDNRITVPGIESFSDWYAGDGYSHVLDWTLINR